MKTRIAGFIAICFLLGSCGDYAALEAIETNKRTADSLFRVRQDTLKKSFTGICDSVYKVHYDRAVDSIKQLRIEGIKGLINVTEAK